MHAGSLVSASAGAGRARGLRQRALQVGFVAAAALTVAVADGAAQRVLLLDAGANAVRFSGALVVAGRVAGGWALGMAFRMQFVRAVEVDRQARLVLGVPACLVAMWPLAVTFLPPVLDARLPGWLAGGGVLPGVAPFAGLVLGLVLSLGVTGKNRR